MPFLSLIGVSLLQLSSSEALGGLAPSLGSAIAGNFAHELTKIGFSSVIERVRLGELAANHDLQRAVRRAALCANVVVTQQFRRTLLASDSAKQAWCDAYLGHLRAEITATRRDDYRVPPPTAALSPEALIRLAEGAPEHLADELPRDVVTAIRDEIRAWHHRERGPLKLVLSRPPADFEKMLAEGWVHAPGPRPSLLAAWDWLTRPRGRAARGVRRSQAALTAQASPTQNVAWFPLFAGFFAEELKTDARAHAIFDARLLANLAAKTSVTLDPLALRDALSRPLAGLGAEFSAHFDRLRIVIEEGQRTILAEIVAQTDARARDRILLESIANQTSAIQADTTALRVDTAAIRADLRALAGRAGTGRLPYGIRRYVAEHFLGRSAELQTLATHLRSGRDCAVVGPAGMGKTALAAKAITDLAGPDGEHLAATPFPDGVIVMDLYRLKAATDPVWHALADALAGPDFQPQSSADKRVGEASRLRRALVVFEGAELADGQEGRATLTELAHPLAPEIRRLVLTRDLAQGGAHPIRLDHALAPEDAAALLDHLAGPALAGHLETRARLLGLLDGHPLALTWAGGFLAQACENPAVLVEEWTRPGANLPRLSDPEDSRHTLRWLFQRSVARLDATGLAALAVAGRLAHASVPLGAFAAALELPAADLRPVLRDLVRRELLRLDSGESGDVWRFTHILGYQFARDTQTCPAPAFVRLGAWCRQSLESALSDRSRPSEITLAITRTLLDHAAALLASDTGNALSYLADDVLFGTIDRLTALGSLAHVETALSVVSAGQAAWSSELASQSDNQRRRSVVFNRLGSLAVAQGNLPDAHRHFSASLAISQRLAESAPANTTWQRDLSVSFNKLGSLAVAQGNLPDAHRHFSASLAIAQRLAESDPANTTWQRDLSVCFEPLGDLAVAQGNLPEAHRHFSTSLSIRQRLAESAPVNTAWQHDLSISFNKLGDLAVAQGNLPEAHSHFSASLSIRQRLAESDPANTAWQRDLSVSFNKLGSIAVAQGNLPEAHRHFSADLSIAQRLAESDPANTAWQRDLSVSFNKLGDLAVAQGNHPDAHRHFSASLAISQRLAESDPANTAWQRDLSVSFYKIADLEKSRGNRTAGLAHAQASLRIDERLAALDPTNATWQKDVRVSRALVKRLGGADASA